MCQAWADGEPKSYEDLKSYCIDHPSDDTACTELLSDSAFIKAANEAADKAADEADSQNLQTIMTLLKEI